MFIDAVAASVGVVCIAMIATDPPKAQDVADALWRLLKTNECIAWAGAGLSVPAGYWSWPTTIMNLCARCGVSAPTPADQLILKAEDCLQADPSTYHTVLQEEFGKPPVRDRRAYRLLTRLPFQGFVTTNVDPLLAEAAWDNGQATINAYPLLNYGDLFHQPRAVYYIHGLARQNGQPLGENLVFAESEFRRAYSDRGSFLPGILNQLFGWHRLCL